MSRMSFYCSMILVICFSIVAVRADYLEVRRSAYIRAESNREAQVVERIEPGSYLDLLDDGRQSNGYYHVMIISQGRTGWIYRTLVRRYPGSIPEPAAETGTRDPLADPTLSLTAEQRNYAVRHLRPGKPQAVYERVRQGYVLAQDARLKIPLWVQYELNVNELQGPASRNNYFKADTSIPFGFRAELGDYRRSGFDRGHMVPAADMKRNWEVMYDSFLLSNMAPQVGVGFNQRIWANLEDAIRGWVEQRGTLTIITGPIFAVTEGQVSYKVIGDNHVAVPTHFYKIVADMNNVDEPEALAFIIPNENLGDRDYSEFLTSIDMIEVATGLDFLSALPVRIQDVLESSQASHVW